MYYAIEKYNIIPKNIYNVDKKEFFISIGQMFKKVINIKTTNKL
jgi:hypothetical protein